YFDNAEIPGLWIPEARPIGALRNDEPGQLLRPESCRSFSQSSSFAAERFGDLADLVLDRTGAAGALVAASASRASRSARSRSVLARVAASLASYSAIAFLPSSARWAFFVSASA